MDLDKTSIEMTVRSYFEAFNNSDTNALTSLFTEDGSIMPPDFITVTGSDQLHKNFTWAFTQFKFHLKHEIGRVLIEGTMASVQAHSKGNSTIISTGKTIPASPYRQLFVLKKTGNKWKITDYMYNSSENKPESK